MFRGSRLAAVTLAVAPLLLLFAIAHAQPKSPAPNVALEPGVASFSVKGLNFETELTGLYLTVDAATSVGRDMDSLLEKNSCTSPGLKRFQDNMLRFALGQQPLRLAGGETLASIAPAKSPGAPFKDSNYTRLLDDLIAENAQGWMMNRYVRGSASGVTVSSRDALGRPSKIVGNYVFEGSKGRNRGSVTVQFSDGLPQCMFFFDFPTTCRAPSRRVITTYENGRYQEQ